MKSKLSPTELLPIIHNSNPELVAEQQPLDDSSRTREVNFEPGDNVWVHLNPIENTWKQGVIIPSVVGVPDSFLVVIIGQLYRRNKCDITFNPPKGDDGVVVGATGNQHAEEQVGTERLRPRPTFKFPKLSTQATLHSDFQM